MIRKFVAALVLIPLALIIVMFAVANRQVVTVAFDPFNAVDPAASLTLPLFLLVFVLVGLGVVIGGAAAWLRQHHWRVRARHAEADNRRLHELMEGRGLASPAGSSPAGTQITRAQITRAPVIVPPAT